MAEAAEISLPAAAVAVVEAYYQVDLGNLMAFHPGHHFPSVPAEMEELTSECITRATELVQEVANELFSLPATEDLDGPIVKLPRLMARLPREKHGSRGIDDGFEGEERQQQRRLPPPPLRGPSEGSKRKVDEGRGGGCRSAFVLQLA